MTTYSTDLRHFLTEKGGFPKDIPCEARTLAEFLGSIVVAVSGDNASPKTTVRCIEKIGEKTCNGVIHAGFSGDLTDPEIGWHCPKCDSSGLINGWEGTIWDMLEDDDDFSH